MAMIMMGVIMVMAIRAMIMMAMMRNEDDLDLG